MASAAKGAAAFAIVPRHVLGRGFVPPSDTLNIAGIGVGGMGRANLINLASQNIVALCDVDWDYAGKAFERLGVDIEHLQARIDQPPPPGSPEQSLSGLNSAKTQTQLDNMKRASEVGAVVLPAMPGFYHGVTNIRDLIDFIVARICDQLEVKNSLIHRWGT